jgi:hypothetical protein
MLDIYTPLVVEEVDMVVTNLVYLVVQAVEQLQVLAQVLEMIHH